MKKIIYFCVLITTFLFSSSSDGRSAGAMAVQKYGSKSGLSSSVAPLQSGGNISTVDGSQSFSSSIGGCAENNEAIKITFTSKSDNIIDININQDLEASGSRGYSYNIPNIKTICSGAVGLTDGKYYKVFFDKFTKKIDTKPSTRDNSGTCFCVLNSCNYGGYRRDIADKFVGDLIGVIGSSGIASYQVGINRYVEASREYFLYVKNDQSCNEPNMGNSYTGTNPTAYYEAQVANPLELSTVIAKDGNKSDSLYYITGNLDNTVITSKNNNSVHDVKIKNEQVCVVQKNPKLDSNGKIVIDIDDGCMANYSCFLDREEICDRGGRNCIDRVLNRVQTSKQMPLQCITFNGEYQVCADGSNISAISNDGSNPNSTLYTSPGEAFFYSKRSYDCGSQTITHESGKTNSTFSSVNKSGSNINYVDFDGNAQVIPLGEFNNCNVKNCRVKINTKHTQVYTDGSSNVSTNDGVSTVEYQFKRCTILANGTDVCPKEANETILDDCSCNIGMNAAGLAIGYASAIEDAVKDFTCSSN